MWEKGHENPKIYLLKRSTCKNWLFFFFFFFGRDFCLSTFTSDSCHQKQDFLLSKQNCLYGQRSPLPSWPPVCQFQGSSHSTWTSTMLLFPWLGLVETVTQRAVLYRHRTGMSTVLKTDSEYWKLTFSCSAALWLGKGRGLQEIRWRLFLEEKCKFIFWPVPSETNFKQFWD